jgi:regulator of protease activity HflC (stomatin/prohibitin superfamily)
VAQIVDLREFVVELSGQLCATQDNVPVSINLLVYQQVVDAAASFLNIQSFRPAVVSLATKQLRSVMREIPFDQVLAERDHIGRDLAEILNDETRRWGVKITNVEVKDLAMASGIKGAA